MNGLDRLIGQVVSVDNTDENGNDKILIGKVISYEIVDYYFYEKNEPIYITVNLEPVDKNEIIEDPDEWSDIPLNYITLY